MATYLTNTTDLTAVADAIRTKGSTSAPLTFPSGFVNAIDAIPTGAAVLGGKTVTYMVDGAVFATQSVKANETVEAPPRPLYIDKVFGYWCTADDGTGTEIDFPYEVTDDITLYAIKFDPWITFKSSASFRMKVNTKQWNGTLEYSTNATNWTTWTGGNTAYAASSGDDYVLYIRGTGNQRLTGYTNTPATYCWRTDGASADVHCIGQISTAFDYQSAIAGKTIETWSGAMYGLFYYDSYIKEGPNIDNLKMTERLCGSMYSHCTRLTKIHPIPFKSIAQYACSAMFNACSSLENVPQLPAIDINTSSYDSMFYDCTALKNIPKIYAVGNTSYAFNSMFRGCTNLEDIYIPNTVYSASDSYRNMYTGCTKIKISTEESEEYHNSFVLPSGGSSCYDSMFASTGGTFTGTPVAGTTYYTPNTIKRG